MTALLLAAQLLAATPACPTVQPSPAFICHNGGWLPPGHPLLPQAPPAPPVPPPTAQPVLVPEFRVGHTYRRDATGAVIHIVGLGVAKNGVAVFSTECVNEATQDQCFFPGQGRLIVANANALGWTEMP